MPQDHLAYVLPSLSAFVYAIAGLFMKRCFEEGAGTLRVAFCINLTIALVFTPMLLLAKSPPDLTGWWMPLLCGVLFFLGNALTFLAVRVGDVSIQTPVMGVKVIIVAGVSALTGVEAIPSAWWVAAALCTLAILLLGMPQGNLFCRKSLTTIGITLGSATSFSLADVLIGFYAPRFGGIWLSVLTMHVTALLSFGLMPFFKHPLREIPRNARPWLGVTCVLLGVQAFSLYFSIAVFQKPTLANIMYSARGLWSVLMVWIIGHYFANKERHIGHQGMTRRLIGACMMSSAILIVITARA